jgi:hypothetical protein
VQQVISRDFLDEFALAAAFGPSRFSADLIYLVPLARARLKHHSPKKTRTPLVLPRNWVTEISLAIC